MLKCKQFTGSSETSLDFIENQQGTHFFAPVT